MAKSNTFADCIHTSIGIVLITPLSLSGFADASQLVC